MILSGEEDLRSLQEVFQQFVLEGHNSTGSPIESLIISTPEADAATRLGIYSVAYRMRLREALQTDFPKLHTMLGDDAFATLCNRYIDACPSDNPSLRWFGRNMAEFLASTDPYSAQTILTEMARFEWLQSAAFDANDQTILRMDQIAAIAPEDWGHMRLVLHPSVNRLDLRWNVPELWKLIEDGQEDIQPLQQEVLTGWVIWRKAMRIHWHSLEVDEACCLDACRKGRDFSELCSILCEWIDEQHVATHAAGLLKRWIEDEMISQVVLD